MINQQIINYVQFIHFLLMYILFFIQSKGNMVVLCRPRRVMLLTVEIASVSAVLHKIRSALELRVNELSILSSYLIYAMFHIPTMNCQGFLYHLLNVTLIVTLSNFRLKDVKYMLYKTFYWQCSLPRQDSVSYEEYWRSYLQAFHW